MSLLGYHTDIYSGTEHMYAARHEAFHWSVKSTPCPEPVHKPDYCILVTELRRAGRPAAVMLDAHFVSSRLSRPRAVGMCGRRCQFVCQGPWLIVGLHMSWITYSSTLETQDAKPEFSGDRRCGTARQSSSSTQPRSAAKPARRKLHALQTSGSNPRSAFP